MWLVSENLDSWRQIPFRIENDIAMLHLKSSEGKQLACWKVMSFSASDSNFFPHPSSTYLATPSLCTALVNNWCVIVRNLFFNIFAHSWSSRHCAVDISSPQFGQEGSLPGLPVFTNSTLLVEILSASTASSTWALPGTLTGISSPSWILEGVNARGAGRWS